MLFPLFTRFLIAFKLVILNTYVIIPKSMLSLFLVLLTVSFLNDVPCCLACFVIFNFFHCARQFGGITLDIGK